MAAKVTEIAKFKTIKTLNESITGEKAQFRQRRIDNSEGQLTLKVGTATYKLINWSRTGLAFEVPQGMPSFPVGLKVGPTKIYVDEIEVYHGDIEIKSVRDQSHGASVLGAEFKSRLFLVDGIEAAIKVNTCVRNIQHNKDELVEVNSDVCKLIVELGSALRILKSTCDEQEEKLTALTFDEKSEILSIFLPSLSEKMKQILNGYSQNLAKIVDIDRIPENSVYHRLFEEHIFPFFRSADFMRRAFEKPRGYAGDYEMMDAIYRGGYEGATLLGKVLHHYAAIEDQSETVLFRKPYFLSHMSSLLDTSGEKSILSIASGPAVEIQEAIIKWTQEELDRTNFILLDLDRAALEHAQTKIYQICLDRGKNPKVEFINASVKSFLKAQAAAGLDLIYSGGLFDYLDNLTCRALINSFYQLLKPGGFVVVGNLTKSNTTKAFCHLLVRWHLVHKSESEMRGWCTDLKNCSVSFDRDPKGTQSFIVIKKN